MGSCKLDHTREEVISKLQSQQPFMPDDLFEQATAYVESNPSQGQLNTLFHLLKKYDLATSDDQQARNRSMAELFSART